MASQVLVEFPIGAVGTERPERVRGGTAGTYGPRGVQ